MTDLDAWQDPANGWPIDEYFEAVADTLNAAGIGLDTEWVGGWTREEPWEATYKLAPSSYTDGPLGWAEHGLFVSWRVDEANDPKHGNDFRGFGWYWVPYSREGVGGDYVKQFELPYLAEPEEVAAAVVSLVRPVGGDCS